MHRGHDAPSVRRRDAARQLGMSFRGLYALIDAGRLPAYKVDCDIKLVKPTSTTTAGTALRAAEPPRVSPVEATSAPGQPAQEKAAHALDQERDLGLSRDLGQLHDLHAARDHVEHLPSAKG